MVHGRGADWPGTWRGRGFDSTMSAAHVLASLLAGLMVGGVAHAASAVHRCVVDGVVTFQQDPCPTGRPRAAPTAEQLNRARRARSEAAAREGMAAAASTPAAASPTRPARAAAPAADPPRAAPGPYRCDGRRFCSQMSSCAEAKFFLANCPGVQMDGDRDGIPCESQWCGH